MSKHAFAGRNTQQLSLCVCAGLMYVAIQANILRFTVQLKECDEFRKSAIEISASHLKLLFSRLKGAIGILQIRSLKFFS